MQTDWPFRLRRSAEASSDGNDAMLADRRRLRWLFGMFVAMALTIYGRLIALEWQDGADYRAAAAEPVRRTRSVAVPRGKIVARDGTVLGYDQPMVDLALSYRWLEEPVNPRWLRALARSQLSPRERRDPQQVAQKSREILEQRQQLWRELAALCGLNDAQWQARLQRIQRKVETIAAGVEHRQQANDATGKRSSVQTESQEFTDSNLAALVGRSVVEALFAADDSPPNTSVTVAEELAEHVVFEGLSLEAVAEIEANPQQYPGVQLLHSFRREYPQQSLAAHLVGYLGAINDKELAAKSASQRLANSKEPLRDDRIGRAGIERQYDSELRGHPGEIVDEIDPRGKVIESKTVQEGSAGQDLVTTVDPALQRSAEALLDSAVARRIDGGNDRAYESGGAVLVMDIHDGAILAAASTPRFDPNTFIQRNNQEIQRWLSDADRPLFDRTVQMALPPGSVFKIISAAALLDSGVNPLAPVDCEGYLHQPDALRCAIYRHFGIGHGPVTLADALARSCNVYFFHYAEQVGAGPLVDWGRRFGLGSVAGIDLPAEVHGAFPTDGTKNTPPADDPRLIAIGQGPVTTTPLQVARIMAAVANGGYLVRPYVVRRGSSNRPEKGVRAAAPAPIPGLNPAMLAVIRNGLRQAVADDEGTAHATVDIDQVAIAGKTGTAEVGGHLPEHAWFAGFVPADRPQVALVVVLEHAGEAATAAGPVVQHLVKRMCDLGYFDKTGLAANRP
jgi:penicillin-binding protein 2